MTNSQKNKCSSIIESAKIRAGVKGSNVGLSTIMTQMVVEIGYVFGYDVSNNMPSDLRTEIFAYSVGSGANKLLTKWIPIVGKGISHASAALCTEEVGWYAAKWFDNL